MRKRLFEIIEVAKENDRWSQAYDFIMIFVIFLSLMPLTVKEQTPFLNVVDKITASIFVIDYLFRLITADFKLEQGKLSFVRYPFTFMAIVDLVSILPSITFINNGFRVLKVSRLFRSLRVFRIFKSFRYSKNVALIVRVFSKQKDSLMVVIWFALGYIVISALVIFNVEPETFDTFFDAIYWATVSLTTMGYGDIYPVSTIGRIVTMLSSFIGIAIVALPAGIITAGYMEELEK
ncbi:MAG: ion transporter [Lachnospiraceae bacterium]|nr:ion transporter [Lachnospiraceae bacterium]